MIPFRRYRKGERLTAADVNRITGILERHDNTQILGFDKVQTGKSVSFRPRAQAESVIQQAIAAAGASYYVVIQVDADTSSLRCQRWDLVGAPVGDIVTVHFPPLLHKDSYHNKTINYPGVGNISYTWLGGQRRRASRVDELGYTVQADEWITPPYVTRAEAPGSIGAAVVAMEVKTSDDESRLTDITQRAWANASEVLF